MDPGRQPRKLRNLIGVQLQSSGLPGDMTVDEAMRFFCAYHGVAPRYDLLERLGLQPKAPNPVSRAVHRPAAAAGPGAGDRHNPPVVILDEPTAGLDVGSRTELHALMQELRDGGTTLILATHDMAEAEKMADRVAILLRGKIVAAGTPRELTATGAGFTKISVRTEDACFAGDGASLPAVSQKQFQEDYAIYYSTDPGPTVAAILDTIKALDDKLIDLRVERPSLEERFLEITDGGAR